MRGVRTHPAMGLSHMALKRQTCNGFVHLEPIGFIPSLQSRRKFKDDRANPSPLFEQFRREDNVSAEEILRRRQHKEVGYSEERQKAQERKFDVPAPQVPVERAKFADIAEDYCFRMLQTCLVAPFSSRQEFDASKAPGHPYPNFGLDTKGAALASELHKELLTAMPDPIWKSTPKGREAIPDEDLLTGKLRTFHQVSLYFAAWQKFFFQNQNEAMKRRHGSLWGKYGYVKQYGGLDRMFRRLEKFTTRFMMDISGYDRVAFLERVYRLRSKGLKLANAELFSKFSAIFDWVVKNTVTPVTSMVDGSIYRRQTGNCSGSNNTTSDNTILHIIVMMYFCLVTYYRKFGQILEYEQMVQYMDSFLFGDDNATALDEQFFGFESEMDLKDSVAFAFQDWGFKVKDKSWKCQYGVQPGAPVSDIEFLGSTGIWVEKLQAYLPRPRVSKLTFSLSCCYSGEVETLEQCIAKVVDIFDLCCWTEDSCLVGSISKYAMFLYRRATLEMSSSIPVSMLDSLLRVATGGRDYTLFLGWE